LVQRLCKPEGSLYPLYLAGPASNRGVTLKSIR
jgi:hypothetical protein